MQGIFINGRRPKSKKEIKEAIASNPLSVSLEATSFFGNEYAGPVTEFVGKTTFVGPDPYNRRNFYGNLSRTAEGKIVVT